MCHYPTYFSMISTCIVAIQIMYGISDSLLTPVTNHNQNREGTSHEMFFQGVNAIHLTEAADVESNTVYLQYDENMPQVCVQPYTRFETQALDNSVMEIQEPATDPELINYVYEIVRPDDLNLKPVYTKRGRPKKKKLDSEPLVSDKQKPLLPVVKTRSGRSVKFPKHIGKDFEKVEVDVGGDETKEVKTTEFAKYAEDKAQDKGTKEEISLQVHQRKRTISAQYRCPKCNKAYLGKKKMIQHIQKYPEHGPMPPSTELNFDVWNYLVDVTQKCPPALRGIKFCEELTNLLHNVLLLTSALFKKVELNKNHVEVDKVLGNAIGLPPGLYKFNDTELYKDVTVLKLITNTDFFKPVDTMVEEKIPEENDKKIAYMEPKVEKIDAEQFINKEDGTKEREDCHKVEQKSPEMTDEAKQERIDVAFTSCTGFCIDKPDPPPKEYPGLPPIASKKLSESQVNTLLPQPTLDLNITTDCDLTKIKSTNIELLSDNSLLNLPNLRNAVDDLILPGVDGGGNILENSASSDEMMNVDQFVNERFKKITEPEMEISGLDLPSLDLFQFHSS
ncbi:unnamed protein product [Acanthoscelides obtectus]|uniref:C2H2-type domain-containing protein n=1 Tax=Acanthoscelides obtectus TaxID=200917 RepID=A0A9P0K1B5_ACAOB|nr:unnamed protein product [Acanthoscelides obtectus]CAK1625221.1 hypothetical protein AOBTE_LOCUS3041 [Acanthoscelides obtectus]